MPAIKSDRPFEHRCLYCEKKPTQHRRRLIRDDDDTGKQRYGGDYYSCACNALTVSPVTGNLNQVYRDDQT